MRKLFFILFILLAVPASVFSQDGIIEGQILDKKTNKPVPFATVSIERTTIGVVSDSAGRFRIEKVKPGFKYLIVNCIGYELTRSDEVQVQGNQTVFIDIPIAAKQLAIKDVMVSGKARIKRIESPVSDHWVEVRQIEKSAGINRDISKLVQTLPGVASTSPNRNDLIVRGGGPSENVFYMDEIEIPVINHFATQGASGGAAGVINPDFVRKMNFHTGAYPANRFNALSSVMDIRLKNGSRDRVHGKLAVGASDAALTIDGPIGKHSTFIVSARQSYLQLLFKLLKLPFLPNYNDFQLKYHVRFNNTDELSILGIGAIDRLSLNTGLKDPDEGQRYILSYLPVYRQWNYAAGAVYKHFAEKHYDILVFSRNMLRNQNYKHVNNDKSLPRTFDYTSDESENKLRYEMNFTKLPIELTVGAGLNLAQYTNETSRRIVIADSVQDLNYNTELLLFIYQLYAQVSDSYFDGALAASLGLYFEGNTFTDYMANPLHQISPRASLSYRIIPDLTLSANIGRYMKRPPYITMGFKNRQGDFANRREDFRYIFSDQAVLGLEYEAPFHLNFSLEGFFKRYTHYPVSVIDGICLASLGTSFGQVGDEQVLSIGKGRAYGLDFSVRYHPKENATFSLTYTLFKSEFTDIKGQYTPSAWDTRHLLNLMGSYTFKYHWNIALRWRFIGGAPYTPIDYDLSSRRGIWDIRRRPLLDYERFNTLRLASAHQLDLRLDKEFYFSKWTLNVYIDVQNVYYFRSESAPFYTNRDEQGEPAINVDDDTRYDLRSFRSKTGTILPTLGIIVKY